MEARSVKDIVIGDRHRKDLGDIKGLVDSIEQIGLLHPIVILSDNTLVVGQRRLEAFRLLGREEIPVNVATSLTDAQQFLRAESDENTCRKDFTPSEAVEVAGKIADLYRPVAEAAQAEGRKHGGSLGGRGKQKPSGEVPHKVSGESARTSVVAATAVGMDRRTLEKAQAVVESGDEKLIEQMNRTGKVNGAFRRLQVQKAVEEIQKEPSPLPSGPFRVIVADPPWLYEKRAGDLTHRGRCPYPSMTIDEIAAMPVGKLAADDSVLWLWTTNTHLPEVWKIVSAWGFEYKSLLTWAKPRMGMGDWLRGQTEHCLLCVRGKPVINLTNQTTLLHGPLRKHSEKPEPFYAMVEELCPGSKVELFCRSLRPGWAAHGNEIAATDGNIADKPHRPTGSAEAYPAIQQSA